MFILRVALAILFLAGLTASAFPAEKPGLLPGAKEAPGPATTDDPLGRSTPKGTVLGFIKSAGQGEYETALQYLDTKKKGASAKTLVDELKTILDRGFSGKPTTLSGKPEGDLDDSLPPSRERIGTAESSSGRLDIILERIQRGNSPAIWLFSADTLAGVPEIYQGLKAHSLEDYLPDFLVNTWVLWFPLWQWFVILLVIPLSLAFATFVTRLLIPCSCFLCAGSPGVKGTCMGWNCPAPSASWCWPWRSGP
jgi:MscS family membrane protein